MPLRTETYIVADNSWRFSLCTKTPAVYIAAILSDRLLEFTHLLSLHSVMTCGVLEREVPSTSVGTNPCFFYVLVGVIISRIVVIVVVVVVIVPAAAAADDDDDDDVASSL